MNNPYRCPLCDKPGKWRHGLHFDHEMICWCSPPGTVTWCPDDVVEANRREERILVEEQKDDYNE